MSDLTAQEVAAIRARAEAATPGPWYHSGGWAPVLGPSAEQQYIVSGGHVIPDDAAHIAGLDPQTVLALCDLAERAARAEAKVERARAVLAALAEGVELANTHNADKRGTDYFDGAYAETQLFVKKLADLRRVLDNEGESDDE